MIDKIKSKAMHYWADHKIECLIVVVLIAVIVIK